MLDALKTAEATLEAMLLVQALRPVTEKAGPAADYAAQSFAAALVERIGRSHG